MSNRYEYVKRSIAKRKRLIDELKNKPCQKCNIIYHPAAMHFHHRDPKTKKFGVGQGLYRNSTKMVLAEIAKCDLLCANCHAIHHFEESGRVGEKVSRCAHNAKSTVRLP